MKRNYSHHSIMSTSIDLMLKTTMLEFDHTQREINDRKTLFLISRAANLKSKQYDAESVKVTRSLHWLIRKGNIDKSHAVDSELSLKKDECNNDDKTH